jgi:hypothetical protein
MQVQAIALFKIYEKPGFLKVSLSNRKNNMSEVDKENR